MRIDLDQAGLTLARGACLRLRGARGTRIVGGGGRLWLTEEGSAQDVFLHRGDAYVVRGDGRVVVGADEDAIVTLDAACAADAA